MHIYISFQLGRIGNFHRVLTRAQLLNPINIAQSIRSVLISNTVHYVEEASIRYQTGKVRWFIKNPKSFPGLWHLNPPPHALVTLGSAAEDNESLPLSSMATLNSLDTTQPTLKGSGPMLLLYLHCTRATGASACITTSAQKTPGWRSYARLLANTTDLTFVVSTNFLIFVFFRPQIVTIPCNGGSCTKRTENLRTKRLNKELACRCSWKWQ